jgi:hypothetical protein
VQVVQVALGARRAGQVPAEPGCVLLDERPAEVASLGQGNPVGQLAEQPPPPGQRVGCYLRREPRGVQQPVDHGGGDLMPGRAAPAADPGLGALGDDHRRQRLAQQILPGRVQVGADQFLLAALPAAGPGGQVAAGDGQFQQFGGRGPGRGLVVAHARAPGEPGRSGGVMPDVVIARRKAAFPFAVPAW